MATHNQPEQALLINYNWHHAVNDQSKLNQVLNFVNNEESNGSGAVEAVEADIIYSDVKSQAVMGHPPSTDGELLLSSFLEQLRLVNFQPQHFSNSSPKMTSCSCPVLKLDFKSMIALQSSLEEVKKFLAELAPCLRQRVWINADILPGPGEDLDDEMAQKRVQPKFVAAEFLEVVTSQLPGTVLSIGWTTSLTDIHAAYSNEMVNDMIDCAKAYSQVTFPVRASSFRKSWQSLQKLYRANAHWTITLWWSYELSIEDFDWFYDTLEKDEELRNRTYYDLYGFRQYLSEHHGSR